MTQKEFYKNICDFPNNFQNRDLETYLCALLKLVLKERAHVLDADLLLKLLGDAFATEPEEFNSEWLRIITPPVENVMIDGIDYSIAVIQFQIAELHKMRLKQLKNEMRYFGIESETGNKWYNFDPMTNLDCGGQYILDRDGDGEKELNVSWRTLGELLEMGRIYE